MQHSEHKVKVNNEPTFGMPYHNADGEALTLSAETTSYEDSARADFGIPYKSTDERATVEYDSHVSRDALRTLTFPKRVYDTDGTTQIHYDVHEGETERKDVFAFRLYLGNENDSASNLLLANMYSYHVKNRAGEYCKWDASAKRFVSLGKTDYAALTEDEKKDGMFMTSMNGSIANIPADYSVEVHDLIAGVQFKVEERDNEIPKGYTRREGDGYVRTDAGHQQEQASIPRSAQRLYCSARHGWRCESADTAHKRRNRTQNKTAPRIGVLTTERTTCGGCFLPCSLCLPGADRVQIDVFGFFEVLFHEQDDEDHDRDKEGEL